MCGLTSPPNQRLKLTRAYTSHGGRARRASRSHLNGFVYTRIERMYPVTVL